MTLFTINALILYHKGLKMNFHNPIKSQNDAEQFFYDLENEGLLFHPEDDPATIINDQGKLIFASDDVELINQRIDEVYMFMVDPCEFIINSFYACETDQTREKGPHHGR